MLEASCCLMATSAMIKPEIRFVTKQARDIDGGMIMMELMGK